MTSWNYLPLLTNKIHVFLQFVINNVGLLEIDRSDVFFYFFSSGNQVIIWNLKSNESMAQLGISVVHLQGEFSELANLKIPIWHNV